VSRKSASQRKKTASKIPAEVHHDPVAPPLVQEAEAPPEPVSEVLSQGATLSEPEPTAEPVAEPQPQAPAAESAPMPPEAARRGRAAGKKKGDPALPSPTGVESDASVPVVEEPSVSSELQLRLDATVSERDQLAGDLDLLRIQVANLELEVARGTELLEQARAERTEQQSALTDTLQMLQDNQDELGALHLESDGLQTNLEMALEELQATREQFDRTQNELDETQTALDHVETKLLQAAELHRLASVELLSQQILCVEAQSSRDELEARIVELDLELEEAGLLQEDLEETIVDRRREIRELRAAQLDAQKLRVEAEELIQLVELKELQLEQRVNASAHLASQREDELLRALELAQEQMRQLDQNSANLVALQRDQVESIQGRLAEAEQDKLRTELRSRILEQELKEALEKPRQRVADEEELRLRAQVAQLQGALAAAESQLSSPASMTEADQWKAKFEEIRETLQTQRRQNDELSNLLKLNQARANEAEERCRELDIKLRNSLRARAREG
jgi:chromosome segregation ATPase